MGKKRITTIGAEIDEEEKRKKEQKKKQKRLEKEKSRGEKKKEVPTSAKVPAEKIKPEIKEKESTEKPEKKLDKKVEPQKSTKEEKEVKKAKKEEKPAKKVEKTTRGKPKKIKPRVIKRGKAYKEAVKIIEKDKIYHLEEAIDLIKKTSPVKFDASIEIHIRLGVDKEKSDQNVRGNILLPHGSGKIKRVLVFTESKEKEAKDAGADQVGGEELINKVEKGFSDFDIVAASPDIMSKIGRLGKILGQRGLMPNPKAGTITDKVGQLVSEIKKGRTEFKMDPQGIIHMVIGKISFDNDKIQENIKALMEEVLKAKPQGLKGDYIKSITLCSTMGPGIKVKY
jgi:large subunit ribosomal protein L1